MAIVVILVVVLAAAGGGAAFFMKSKGGADDTSAPATPTANATPTTPSTPKPTTPASPKTTTPATTKPTASKPASSSAASPAVATPPASTDAPKPPATSAADVDTAPAAEAKPTTPPPTTTDAPVADAPVADAPVVEAAPTPAPVAKAEGAVADRLAELDTDDPDDPDGFDLSRFGSAGHRTKDPRTASLLHEPMAPAGRVYDMEGAPPAATASDRAEPTIDEPSEPAADAIVGPSVDTSVDAAVEREPDPEPAPEPVAVAEPAPAEPAPEPADEPEPVAAATSAEPEPAAPAPEPEPTPEPTSVSATATADATDADEVIELPRDDAPVAPAPPHDAVDHVLQALIGRAKERQVALAQVAAELVEQANLEDRELDEVLGDLIDLAEDDETVDPGERLEELTMFNEAVPKRPGQLTDFARLDSREKKRVIIRVLCLLVALQEDYKLQPQEPASEAETRSWPLARAVWPVKADTDDDDEHNLPGRRRKGKLATR
jgi:hypothetical protein